MNMEKLRQSSQYRLLTLISSINAGGPKDLAIHEDLMKPLDQVVGARKLRDNGVEKMFKLGSCGPPWKNYTRIYLIPASYSVAENVSQQLKADKIQTIEYHVIIVPKVLASIQALFESFGVLDLGMFHSFSWDFIPLDRNLISLEMSNCFHSTFVGGDNGLLASISKALMSFECLYGKFQSVMTLGKASSIVHNLLEVWHSEVRPTFPPESEYSHLIVMDRDVDFASLLLTQLTYEGVLEENFGVNCGFITLNSDDKSSEVQRIMLNSTKDDIYAEIQGKHISSVFSHLGSKAKHLQGLRDKKNTNSIEEMKHFVANDLKHIQAQQKSLGLHVTACEMVMKCQTGVLEELLNQQQNIASGVDLKGSLQFIEDSMARRFDCTSILRLLCLYALLHEGLPDHKIVLKQFLQSYGYHYLPVLNRLQHLQMLCAKDASVDSIQLPDKLARVVQLGPHLTQPVAKRPSFRTVCQRLNLTSEFAPSVAGEATKSSQHPSYVFGGSFTPLVYRLVEKCVARDRDPAALDDLARCYGNDLRSSGEASSASKILVLVVGGVTRAEAAALDLLAKQLGRPIVVAGTNIISGPVLIRDVSLAA